VALHATAEVVPVMCPAWASECDDDKRRSDGGKMLTGGGRMLDDEV